jgi:membrane protein involved in colicin uptake
MAADYICAMPHPGAPIAEPDTGQPSEVWYHWAQTIFRRSGGSVGIATGAVQTQAAAAQTSAAAAQAAAIVAAAATATETAARIAADTAEATARATADTAEATTRATADTSEASARTAADALLLPKANPVLTGSLTNGVGGPTWTHGTGAPAATAPQGSLYTNDTGAVGATLYVSRGGGVWNAVAGV